MNVDDIIVTGDNAHGIAHLEIKNLGSLWYFLGIEVTRFRKGITLPKDNNVLYSSLRQGC